jgi:DNA-binding Lrp family transcriptional regulator
MTPAASGSSPRRVDDPAVARLLMDATTREVFGCFLGRARSVKEAADALGRDLDAVLYRVRRLAAAGLLEVAAIQPRAGRPIRRYRAVHDDWFVPFEALPYADLEETFLEVHAEHTARAARAAARWLADRPWAGYRIGVDAAGRMWMRGAAEDDDALGTGPPRSLAGPDGPLDAGLDLRLSPADARSLNADLAALVATYERRALEGPPNRLLLVISVPTGDG